MTRTENRPMRSVVLALGLLALSTNAVIAAPTPNHDSQTTCYYTQLGDTCESVAAKYCISVPTLQELNPGLDCANPLCVGKRLTVDPSPQGGVPALPETNSRPPVPGTNTLPPGPGSNILMPPATGVDTRPPYSVPENYHPPMAPVHNQPPPSTQPLHAPAPVQATPGYHLIEPNDICYNIAPKYHLSLQELRDLNPGLNCQFLQEGKLLNVRKGSIPRVPQQGLPSHQPRQPQLPLHTTPLQIPHNHVSQQYGYPRPEVPPQPQPQHQLPPPPRPGPGYTGPWTQSRNPHFRVNHVGGGGYNTGYRTLPRSQAQPQIAKVPQMPRVTQPPHNSYGHVQDQPIYGSYPMQQPLTPVGQAPPMVPVSPIKAPAQPQHVAQAHMYKPYGTYLSSYPQGPDVPAAPVTAPNYSSVPPSVPNYSSVPPTAHYGTLPPFGQGY